MMAAIRREIAWHERATARSLPPSVVGGLPVPAPQPMSVYPCPEPGCLLTDRDPETVFLHAFEQHGRDRRGSERRSAA